MNSSPRKSRAEKLASILTAEFSAKVRETLGKLPASTATATRCELYYSLGEEMKEMASAFDSYKKADPPREWINLLHRAKRELRSIDHWFFAKDPDNPSDFVLVSEPYNLTMEDFEELTRFCDEEDLEYYVEGFSVHFPAHTFRITIRYKPTRQTIESILTPSPVEVSIRH